MANRTRHYLLKNYDETLVDFSVREDTYGVLSAETHEKNDALASQFPLSLMGTDDPQALVSWLQTRTVPKNRQFVDKILKYSGLAANDAIGIIDVCRGLSVNDAFWVDHAGNESSFSQMNLYDNELDEALAVVAYTGYTDSQRHNLGLSTEWTSSGQYPKAWRRIDGELVLYKAGSEGFANAGMEPYSEYFASQLAQAMGINAVCYDLDEWKGKLASTCPLLNDKDTALVPFYAATGQSTYPKNLAVAALAGEELFEGLCSMIVFDALICNTDRHGANYGFLRDNRTGDILGLAPLYDHNLALFPGDMESDFPSWMDGSRGNELVPRTGGASFKQQAASAMGPLQHEQLRRAIGFRFENHPAHPMPQKRLDALNAYLARQVSELLDLPVIDRKQAAAGFIGTLNDDEREPILLELMGKGRTQERAPRHR